MDLFFESIENHLQILYNMYKGYIDFYCVDAGSKLRQQLEGKYGNRRRKHN